MCGIAGLFRAAGLAAGPLPELLRRLAHRGPDGQGERVFSDPSGRPYAAIGARRLAIVDPSGGEQPMSDHEQRYWIVLNGEIYNHHQIRKEMASNDYPYRTVSDTEVVASLLSMLPTDRALSRMDGMFALAIVDTVERRLTLVRDRVGVKPLYWAKTEDGGLAFASELGALRAVPGLRWRPNREALQASLLFEYIPTPLTPWMDVFKLEPGTLLEVDEAGVRTRRWWTPPVPVSGDGGNLERWARSVYGAVQVAVMHRMLADVEVGYLLSGGLDSSFVTALAAARSRGPVKSFAIAVDAPGLDEGGAARAAAAGIGTEHREARLVASDLPRLLGEIRQHMDEPIADSSLVPTLRLMELVSESGLRCVMSGDGADEAFAGYPTCRAHQLAPLATPASGLLRRLTRHLPTRSEGVTADYMARRFTLGLGLPWARRHQIWMGAWLPEELDIGDESAVWAQVDAHALAAEHADPASRALYLDSRLYMSDGVLVKMDRASMAHGIEVRSPFLDRSVVELAASIPIGHKLHGRDTKHVLRVAAKGTVPDDVLRRAKHGFGAPVGPWLRGPNKDLLNGVEDTLSDLIPPAQWRRVVAEHMAGQEDHRRRLWSAVILANWRVGPWGGA